MILSFVSFVVKSFLCFYLFFVLFGFFAAKFLFPNLLFM